MAIIHRKSDRIKVKIEDITLVVSPLSQHDKNTIQSLLVSGKVDSIMNGATMALKCAIKDIGGVTHNNEQYRLEFDDNKHITDDCLDDLMNLEMHDKISSVCLALLGGIPKEFLNAETGEVLEGVRIIKAGEEKK